MTYHIHCPYCLEEVYEDTIFCPVCKRDTRQDAKVEMTIAQYEQSPRKPCRFCGKSMLKLAVVCPSCKERQ